MKDTDRMPSAGIIQNCVILKQVVSEVCKANAPFYLSIIHFSGMQTKFAIETVLMIYTGRFVIFSVIINIYNKKTKGPTIM